MKDENILNSGEINKDPEEDTIEQTVEQEIETIDPDSVEWV